MSNKDPRVDEYIAKSAQFARPILKHLRALVHQGCPEAEEAIKWRMPAFLYKKRILCMIAGFKQHATLHFWRHKLVVGKSAETGALGEFGKITSLQDLPTDTILLRYIRKAIELNGAGDKTASRLRAKLPIRQFGHKTL